jgi:hypothetical protein
LPGKSARHRWNNDPAAPVEIIQAMAMFYQDYQRKVA